MEKMSKGMRTKMRILESAKNIFYEHGYDDAIVQQIADESGTTLGSLTYHFATKTTIVDAIMSEYLQAIRERIHDTYKKDTLNHFKEHFFLTIIYYNNLLNDDKTKRFYYETHLNSALFDFLFRDIGIVYQGFIKDFNLRFTPGQFDATLIADLGARRASVLAFYNGQIHMTVNDFAAFLISNTGRMFSIQEDIIYESHREALAFYKTQDFSDIKVLV